MLRFDLLAGCALAAALFAAPATAQDLQNRPVAPPPVSDPPIPAAPPAAADADQVQFSAGSLEYDTDSDVVTALTEVRMFRQGDRLRADKVVWNRKTGKVVATGNIAVTNPEGDVAYGDSIELTDSLKDGMVQNMLVVLEQGGRMAAERGTRLPDGTMQLDKAAYTPCAVETSAGCPKEPSWKITAVRITYRPDRERVFFGGGRFHLFGLPALPLPAFSMPIGGSSESGLLAPDVQLDRVNGLEFVAPYYFRLAPNKGLTLTPHVFTAVLPMMQAQYDALGTNGAFRVTGYLTESRRSDDLNTVTPTDTERALRGYIDGVARYQLSPYWSVSGSARIASDRTFLRRYDISRDDRLRTTASLERIDPNTYFALTGWYVQTLRVNDSQGNQPIALPELDFRKRIDLGGGKLQLQANTLAITRTAGQDTQRAFVAGQWDLRRLTDWGQEVTLTAYARADAYNTNDAQLTSVASYRGIEGFQTRAIGALAADVKWPFVGSFLGGTQRLTPRVQIVAAPKIANLDVPNEDARAVDLEDSNLFALNRFAGYDRFEDSSRATYGAEWAVTLPGMTLDAVIGQSYRLSTRPTIFPSGTGLSDRFSDFVGRTTLRIRDFVSITHRYRLDKDGFAVRRNEIDATVGSRNTYVLAGYLRLNRDIFPTIEDLQDREEVRLAGRVQFARFWSVFGSTVVDLTDRSEDPQSLSDGFDPIRHRLGVQYEDDCIRLGATWRRDYQDTGDARSGNSFLFTLALTNLGR
ncbi:LPS assembly protein LptD [Sphingomonas sp. RP10(2022)]|uniref:LPS-assembly protein LptD n=1 Tax=Sphingomonas liriopis TaxID=2949094 RepID=A0A9X2HLZ9_9SPHN|nr:LPS assembly protein LptD [Sphingomonas liriopis]